jgi:phenylacetate-coenzyme A ligase PaaK-like adenylate-forming protein
MSGVIKSGNTPYLFSFASSAVRLCKAAKNKGIDLRGANFIMAGEPITEDRLAVLERNGAKGIPIYASAETGVIGTGCLNPEAADEVHLAHDLYALIQPEQDENHLSSNKLFITSIENKAPFIMLNLSLGDQAMMTTRKCDCPLQHLGWETHLLNIRSYEKLTAGGITLLDSDLIAVLENILPSIYGGYSTDYQLLEEEIGGEPRLTLLVNPEIGNVDLDDVGKTFLEGIHSKNSILWRTPGFFKVKNQKPILATSGKMLHLHSELSN